MSSLIPIETLATKQHIAHIIPCECVHKTSYHVVHCRLPAGEHTKHKAIYKGVIYEWDSEDQA